MSKQILVSLLNCSWQWGLLVGVTWLVTRRLRRSNTTFHLLWLLSLISLPILFGLNQFVPALSIQAGQPEFTPSQPVDVSSLALPAIERLNLSAAENQAIADNHTLIASGFFANFGLLDGLLCVWASSVLIMLVRLSFGLYRIGQLRRSATVADESYQAVCRRFAQKMKIGRPVTVCFSDQVVSPISFGWLSPRILIPQTLSLKQFELVAAHELAHVRRLDWLTNLFSHLVGAVFFFHPFYHLLSRRLANLREQICDDWVIQLTGARKNYAQCLLDLVRHKNQSIPLALALNQPSKLESRINSILKGDRQLNLQLKPRLLLIAAALLLTSLPLLAMAQLVPLRTIQLSLFTQTDKKSEKAVDKENKMDGEQKMEAKEKSEKHKSVKVLDPADFDKNRKEPLFSGPQPGEKLSPLKATGVRGEFDGKTFDVIAKADGKPQILIFLGEEPASGGRALYGLVENVARIGEKSKQELHTCAVFLGDDSGKVAKELKETTGYLPKEIFLGVSPDGREGPGTYGLNRNVAMTIIIAKDGRVTHNFPFQQFIFSPDPHVLGAIANVLGVERETLAKWLNEEEAEDKQMQRGGERMENSREMRERGQTMERKRYENRRRVAVKDPAEFKKPDENPLFSGPQSGEKLPPLQATGVRGELDGKTFDVIAEADGKPLVLFLQDENRAGFRGLIGTSHLLDKIASRSEREIHTSVVFLGDDSAALSKQIKGLAQHVPQEVLLGVSPDGREGPGTYGLNRNVAMTILVAKDGKVTHNFAFPQSLLYADPHVLGAIANVLGEKPETLEKWLNEQPAEDERMQRGERMERPREMRERSGERERERARENRRRVEVKDPADFMKSDENPLFSGPQLGEKLPPLPTIGVRDEFDGKTFDVIAEADGKPLVLFFQGADDSGIRGLIGMSRLLADIANRSEREIRVGIVFLNDDPSAYAKRVKQFEEHVPQGVLLGVSPDGREGPGSYGLNRNLAATILIAKDGKVTHNFAFQQGLLYADPHVLGAVADVIGVEYETVSKWLNEEPAEGERMERRREREPSDDAKAFGAHLREMVEKGEITGEEARKRYEKAFPRK